MRVAALGAALFVAATPAATPSAAATSVCDVSILVTAAAPLGALEVFVSYAGAAGEFQGTGTNVACDFLPQGAVASEKDDDAARELDLGMISGAGIAVPADFWRCTFVTESAAPDENDFEVTVDEALGVDLSVVPTAASIGDITCGPAPSCGNGVIEGTEECDAGAATAGCTAGCELTRNSQRCDLDFRVTGAKPIAGVQFRVDYGAATGEFLGEGVNVECEQAIDASIVAADDRDGEDELRLALAASEEFPLPADVWTCRFLSTAKVVVPASFTFSEVIATDDQLQPVSVTVAAVVGDCVSGPFCGDGNKDPEEACDDGNRVDTDACTNACANATCGDGITRTGIEQCDDGNQSSSDCCSPACAFSTSTTVCRAAAGVCDKAESCTGASAACPANSFQPVTTACTSDGNPCTTDRCDGSGACVHPNNADSCNDGIFCNGADTCSGGACAAHSGNPCPGIDGDADCSETCSESNADCTANDPNGAVCNDGSNQTGGDQCNGGICAGSGGAICGDADGNGKIQSSDALRALRASVNPLTSCPLFRCDTNDSGSVNATDALRILRKAVGQVLTLNCPPQT